MTTPHRNRLIWSILLLCLLAGPALAQEKRWVNLGIGGGGGIFLPVSSPHDPKLIFCTSDMGGVYRSTDYGKSWAMMPFGQIHQTYACPIVYHPTDPNILFNVAGPWSQQYLRMSKDKGQTWSVVGDMPWTDSGQVTRLGIDAAGQIMLVGAEKATFRSTDMGMSWSLAQGLSGAMLNFVLPPPVEGANPPWYAGTVGGVYCSTDRGVTWTACPSQPGEKIEAFCGGWDSVTGRSVLYASLPTGQTDGKLTGGIVRSDDGGQTWTSAMGKGILTTVGKQDGGTREFPSYPFLAMAENQTNIVYAYCYGTGANPPYHSTIYRSDDGGKEWRAVLFGPAGMPGQNVELGWRSLDEPWMSEGHSVLSMEVNPRNSDCLGFTNMMEIYLTDNGGKSWRQAYSRCTQGEGGKGKAWESIGMEMTTTWHYDFDPNDPKRCYISYTDIVFARSEDRGKSWYYSAAGIDPKCRNTIYAIDFDPAKPGVIYAAAAYEHDIPSWKMADSLYGLGTVLISTDYAKSWRAIGNGLPTTGPCMAVVLDPNSPPGKRTLYAAFYGAGIFKSTDGGESWQAANKGIKLDQNSHVADLKLHADGKLLALVTANRKERYVSAAPGALYVSDTAGESWTDAAAKLKLAHPYGFDVDPRDSDVIYIGASDIPKGHGQGGLYKTNDGGQSWSKLNVPWPGEKHAFVDAMFPSADPYTPERVWVSAGTGLMLSTDAGTTWREVKGLPFRMVTRITVDPEDHESIYVTTFGGGVWRGPAIGTE